MLLKSVLTRLYPCNISVLRAMASFEASKEKFLNRSDEERKGPGVVTLDQVPCYEEYFKIRGDASSSTLKELQNKFQIPKYSVNEKLNKIVTVWRGDITKLMVDAIVNAANTSLLGGGGVDGAIHRAAGNDLYEECKLLMGCETGEAKITGGYRLPAKYVIHTVGPRITRALQPDLLRSCYSRSLELACENNIRTIAFPCISTGIYGYPQEDAANEVLSSIRKYLENDSSKFDRIIFCVFLDSDVTIYETLLQLYFPVK